MNIPALLIEYLITGGFAIIWIVPLILLFEDQSNLCVLKSFTILFGIPLLYVIGLILDMFCEYIASKTKMKQRIRDIVNTQDCSKYGEVPDDPSASIYIRLHNNDLANEFEKRSSRDRIARGATLNLFLASAVIPWVTYKAIYTSVSYFILLLSLSYISFRIWKVCEMRSYRFKLRAYSAINKEYN